MQTIVKTHGDTLFIPDSHFPFQDEKAWSTMLEFARYLKPQRVIFLGDHFDAMQISKFDNNPNRLLSLQQDIDDGVRALEKVRKIVKDAKIYFVEGNHERRLVKFLWKHPEIAGLRSLAPEKLFGFEDLGIEFYPEEKVLEIGGFIVTHGTRISKHSGWSARLEFEKWGCNGISGHSHRQGTYCYSSFFEDYFWYEAGCLCSMSPPYFHGRPNWQHGLAIGDFLPGDKRFTIHLIRIDRKGRIYHHGKVFDGK